MRRLLTIGIVLVVILPGLAPRSAAAPSGRSLGDTCQHDDSSPQPTLGQSRDTASEHLWLRKPVTHARPGISPFLPAISKGACPATPAALSHTSLDSGEQDHRLAFPLPARAPPRG